MKKFSITLLFPFMLFGSFASAEVLNCSVLKTTRDTKSGGQSTSTCSVKLDSNDLSGSQGSGGIIHNLGSLGTLSTDCTDLPLSYDKSGKLVPIQIYKQGEESQDYIVGFSQFMVNQGYATNGKLGFDLSNISKLEWAAGGQDTLVYFYTAYDSSGNKLGTLFFPIPSMKFSFQGCYLTR